MEKYKNDLMEASRHLRIADHMTYVTFPLVNEHRLLLKIFDEVYLSIINCVNCILNYESLYKRIRLYSSLPLRHHNMETPAYGLTTLHFP